MSHPPCVCLDFSCDFHKSKCFFYRTSVSLVPHVYTPSNIYEDNFRSFLVLSLYVVEKKKISDVLEFLFERILREFYPLCGKATTKFSMYCPSTLHKYLLVCLTTVYHIVLKFWNFVSEYMLVLVSNVSLKYTSIVKMVQV